MTSKVTKAYFKNLYTRAVSEAYSKAMSEIYSALETGGRCLDCGAYNGHKYKLLQQEIGLDKSRYDGVEWNKELIKEALENGISLIESDLNLKMPFNDESYRCIFSLSVLEHILNPCLHLKECYRCLENDGKLIILTPNISTFFTIALLLVGKMPSSGPHPDSDHLLKQEELFKVSDENLQWETESETPAHRHLIVFSYRVLYSYLKMLGFKSVEGYGFGLYPFPNFLQNILEKLDPYHCHQMVFVAKK